MKFAQAFNEKMFDDLDIDIQKIYNNNTDKLYKFILIDDNFYIIKVIEKAQLDKDKPEITFNKFHSSQIEIEKDIKSFKGIIYIYTENKKKNSDVHDFFKKIEKSLFILIDYIKYIEKLIKQRNIYNRYK